MPPGDFQPVVLISVLDLAALIAAGSPTSRASDGPKGGAS